MMSDGRLYLNGDLTELRVNDDVTFKVQGRVVMISENSIEVEIEDAVLEGAKTMEEAGQRAMRALLRDNDGTVTPPFVPSPS